MSKNIVLQYFIPDLVEIISAYADICPKCNEYDGSCDHCNIGSSNEITDLDDTFNPLWRITDNKVMCNYHLSYNCDSIIKCNNYVSSAELKKDMPLYENGFFCKHHIHECDDYNTCPSCFGVFCYICGICPCENDS